MWFKHTIVSNLLRRTNSANLKRYISKTTNRPVLTSQFPNIPPPNVTVDEYLWKKLDRWPHKIATICADTGRSYTYSDLHSKSKALANFLHAFPNLQQGDTIAVVLTNVPEYPIVVLGGIQAGLKVTTINPAFTPEEISKQLKISEAKLVVTLTDLSSKVDQSFKSIDLKLPVVVIKHNVASSIPDGSIKLEEILANNPTTDLKIERRPDDTILLPFSSGTTGLPKAVALTHRNVISALHSFEIDGFDLQHETTNQHQDTLPLLLPMFHLFGLLVCMLNQLKTGGKLVTIPKYSTALFLDILGQYQSRFVYLVPPLVHTLTTNSQVTPKTISSLETIVSAAAPLRTEDIKRLDQLSGGKLSLLQGYGLTETSALLSIQTSQHVNGIKIGGSGLLASNTQCKFVSIDDDGDQTSAKELGPNQPGHILVRGPQIMKGYYKNDQATRETINSDGWMRTGDIGYYDKDEHFFITDRIKDLIKVKGFQVAPAELEAVLRSHPDVLDAAVVGVPHEHLGEAPRAYVVLKTPQTRTANIEEFVTSRVASYKKIVGGIIVVESIPKNASGKILRRQLRQNEI